MIVSQVDEAFLKLAKLYKVVWDDPYWRHLKGDVAGFKRYLKKFDRMMDTVGDAIQLVGRAIFKNNVMFGHDIFTFIEMARYDKTDEECLRDREILVVYLRQVGEFINTRKFDRYSVYSTNEKRWWTEEFIEADGVFAIADSQLKEFEAVNHVLKHYREGEKRGGWDDPEKHWSPPWKSIARRLLIMEKEGKL